MEPQNVRYHEVLLELFKKELEANPQLSMARFCKEHNARSKSMLNWIQRQNISIQDIKNEVLRKQGILSESECMPTSGELYQNLLEDFKKRLMENPQITLSGFCKERGISTTRVTKWLRRQNLTVYDIKVDCKIASGIKPTEPIEFSKGEVQRFQKCLRQYKEILFQNSHFPFSVHCHNNLVSEYRMRCWMKRMGLTVKQLQKYAALNSTVPNHPKSVFIQFKPNGGTNGDRLSGVVIKMADGTCVTVDECTVISLCSFITMYNNDQKKNKDKHV